MLCTAAVAASLGCASVPTAPADPKPAPLLTVAQSSGWQATSTYDETIAFLEQLDARSDRLRLTYFGQSAAGRPLPLLIASRARAFEPKTAISLEKPIVLIVSGIHPGEVDGKVASLMILSELIEGKHHNLLDRVTLLFVPIYNVDGHERVSRFNRPNQFGPVEGMGFRATNDGHDLNRDHLKLVTPEAQALIDLFNQWRPHLIVDNHVTNGVDHDWVLTYSYTEAPQLSPHVSGWLDVMMQGVLDKMKARGQRVGPYVSLRHEVDPTAGFSSWVGEPRYSTGYFPLRNRATVLVENHSHKSFKERTLANREFLLALIQQVNKTHSYLLESVAKADADVVALGAPAAAPSDVAVTYTLSDEYDLIELPIYEFEREPSTVTGREYLKYRRGNVSSITVPWYHKSRVDLAVERPRGYVVLPGWPQITQRLEDHGLKFACVAAPLQLEVETIRVAQPQFDPRPYQGLTRVSASVSRQLEMREIPVGALWIPADQPDFNVAVQLFEPEAPDSLFSWGLLSSVVESKEYIGIALLEDLSRQLLTAPGVAEEWNRALEDESFRDNWRARYMWWYRKTPYYDEQIGLLPIYRIMNPAPPFAFH